MKKRLNLPADGKHEPWLKLIQDLAYHDLDPALQVILDIPGMSPNDAAELLCKFLFQYGHLFE